MSRARRARVWRLIVAWAASCALPVCGAQRDRTGGSETHFLKSCESGCASGFECECGVCTSPCRSGSECERWASAAECVPSAPRVATGACPASSSDAFCELSCLLDSDCSSLGASYACEAGYCRESATDSAGPDSTERSCDPTALGADDLVVIGDSMIQLSTFTSEFEAAAVAAGGVELAQDEHLRDYSESPGPMLAQGTFSVANEYAASQEDGPARVVVMDGGAADMVLERCPGVPTTDCPAVQAAVQGAEVLLGQMAEGGVQHVVYFFYPDATQNLDLKAGLDVLRPLIRNACGRSPVPCHWLDLRPAFEGHPEYSTGEDGLVFSDAGARVSARAVWQLIQERCIAP
jgi:hypothetical protein